MAGRVIGSWRIELGQDIGGVLLRFFERDTRDKFLIANPVCIQLSLLFMQLFCIGGRLLWSLEYTQVLAGLSVLLYCLIVRKNAGAISGNGWNQNLAIAKADRHRAHRTY